MGGNVYLIYDFIVAKFEYFAKQMYVKQGFNPKEITTGM